MTIALDALGNALNEQARTQDESFGLLSEIALSQPRYARQVQLLRQELLALAVAAASVREQLEPDPEFESDPAEIRDRLATLTRRFRQYLAREADLVYDATGLDLQAELLPEVPQS